MVVMLLWERALVLHSYLSLDIMTIGESLHRIQTYLLDDQEHSFHQNTPLIFAC